MAIIYQKRLFFVLFLFMFVIFLTSCSNRNEKRGASKKSYQVEGLLWSDIRKDSLLVLKGCQKLLQEFPESAQAQLTAYLGYANYYEKKKDNHNALAYAQRALALAEKNGLKRELAYCHIQLTEISNNLNDLNEMSIHLQKVYEILEKSKISDELLWSKYHEEKGLYFRKIQKYNNAILEFRKMLSQAQKKQLFFQEAQANFYISWMFSETSEFKKSTPYINKAVELLEKHHPTEVADMYYEKAIVMLAQNNNQAAEEAILKSQMYFTKYQNYNSENKGVICNVLGDIYKNRGLFNQAKAQYAISFELLKKPINIKYLYSSLFNYYEKTGQYQSALVFQRKYLELKDSLFSKQLVIKANDFELKYQLSLKEKEYLIKENQSQVLLLIAFICLLLIITITIFIVRNNASKMVLAKKEAHLKNIESELKERKLATNTLFISQQNQLLNMILSKVERLMYVPDIKDSKEELAKVVKFIKSNKQDEVEWDNFKLHFDSVSPKFFNTLKANYPNLTELDLKHCAYIKINFTPKQVAHLLGISPKSVTLFRVRLKKKLNLAEEISLSDFLREV